MVDENVIMEMYGYVLHKIRIHSMESQDLDIMVNMNDY